MRRFVLFLSLFCVSCLASRAGDDVAPLLKDGRTWTYETRLVMTGSAYTFRHTVGGDTLIDGKSWKKILRSAGNEAPVYEKAMREEGTAVYECFAGGEPRLFADFGLGVGTRVLRGAYEGDECYYEVKGFGTVRSRGHSYKTISIEVTYPELCETSNVEWTVGIGGDCGIESAVSWADYTSSRTTSLLSVYDGADCIYATGDDDCLLLKDGKVWNDAPTQGFYDLQGRHIGQAPRRGLYIRDGRKVMIK